MNRRDLFKFAAFGAAGILIPEIIKPVTYFLPPSMGWGAQRLKIRRVVQYLINDDTYPIRYDGTWDLPNGEGIQMHVDFDPVPYEHRHELLEQYDEMARRVLENRMYADHGNPNSAQFKLAMPGGVEGCYLA